MTKINPEKEFINRLRESIINPEKEVNKDDHYFDKYAIKIGNEFKRIESRNLGEDIQDSILYSPTR